MGENQPSSNRWENLKNLYRKSRPYLLSHHPTCENYQKHTFSIGSQKFCIGCFIGYPAAMLGISITQLLLLQNFTQESVFIAGNLLLLTILWSFFGWTDKKPLKMLQKFAVGFGAGMILTFFWNIFPWAPWINFIAVLFLFMNLNFPMLVLHYRSHNKICAKCGLTPEFGECPGYPLTSTFPNHTS